MTSNRRDGERMRLGGIEVVSPSLDNGNGSAGNNAEAGDSGVLSGPAAKGEEKVVNQAPEAAEPAVPDRSHVPPGVLADLRKQVADFADFAHRGRVNLLDYPALGSGGGITAEVVRTIAAEAIRAQLVPALGIDEQALCDSLMLALVAPSDPIDLTERQKESFRLARGQLMLDVSAAEVGSIRPVTRLVAPPVQPRPEPAAADEENDLAADSGDPQAPAAAVIVGAAAIAERPFLSLDSVLSHARRAVFRDVSPSRHAQTAGNGMRAARRLEIVVLLDSALGGGLWIDIDPETSRPAAALAIALPAPPARIRFTHVPLPTADEPRMLLAG
jgi:hypothetical protein